MSIVRWLKTKESSPLLPVGDASTSAANKEVEKAEAQQRKKRGTYYHYNDELRAKIAKYSCENGNKAAVAKFSSELGHDVSESTVRNMKKTYLSKLREERNPDNITSLPHAARGRPLMLGSYDSDVASYVQSLRIAATFIVFVLCSSHAH